LTGDPDFLEDIWTFRTDCLIASLVSVGINDLLQFTEPDGHIYDEARRTIAIWMKHRKERTCPPSCCLTEEWCSHAAEYAAEKDWAGRGGGVFW